MFSHERLIKYVKFATGSDENSTSCPSSKGQSGFADELVREFHEMGINNAEKDENGYVYAHIPANDGGIRKKKLGFIAHMDTISDVCFENVNPQMITNYDGSDIILNKEKNIVLSASKLPESCIGKDLIVTDGTTLLGADDKAGIAEIMTFAEKAVKNEFSHGELRIAFTPDEEIGRGTDKFDVEKFDADYAYTVDGGLFGEITYENFNASNAKITVHGVAVHPGEAKYGGMKNASNIAFEFDSMLPKAERPEYTELYEGFYHLLEIKGNVEKAEMRYILRDHSKAGLIAKKMCLEKTAEFLNCKYGKGTVDVELFDSYFNMEEYIRPHFFLVDNAVKAIEKAGGKVDTSPIRGGTDGARLSERGLPCPNLGTASANHHGIYEYAVVQDMEKVTDVLVSLSELIE